MRTALVALVLSLASPTLAAPRHHADDGAAEVDHAKAALKLAKAKAKAAKAVARATKAQQRAHDAVEACEQAQVDLCVAGGLASCEDSPALLAACH